MTAKPNDVFVAALKAEIDATTDPQRRASLGAELVLGLLPRPADRVVEADLALEVAALEAKARTAGPADRRVIGYALAQAKKNLAAARRYRAGR